MVKGEWTPQERGYAWRYLEVCRQVHRRLPDEEAWNLLREYGPLAHISVAAVERAWAREKDKRGLA
jgi:hypothetical protein